MDTKVYILVHTKMGCLTVSADSSITLVIFMRGSFVRVKNMGMSELFKRMASSPMLSGKKAKK